MGYPIDGGIGCSRSGSGVRYSSKASNVGEWGYCLPTELKGVSDVRIDRSYRGGYCAPIDHRG